MNAISLADETLIEGILTRAGWDINGPGYGPRVRAGLSQLGKLADADTLQIVATYGTASPATVALFAAALARVAESQIGTEEDAKHSNKGSAILKYQQATNLDGQGWPWCAAFVDWCFKEAAQLAATDAERPRATLERPETASAFGLIDWAKTQQLVTFTGKTASAPQRGDIVVYTFSHTGIVTGYTGGTSFSAVEGNTNEQGGSDGYQVARRTRQFSEVKSFIRVA